MKWLRELFKIKPKSGFQVLKINEENGTEVRRYYNEFGTTSYKVHVNDEIKFKKHLKELSNSFKID